jgi:hypothetical protein
VDHVHPRLSGIPASHDCGGRQLDRLPEGTHEGSYASDTSLFKGGYLVGEYNGVLLVKAPRITNGVNSTTGAAVANARRAVLVGAQAGMFAMGRQKGEGEGDKFNWVEEEFDYGNQLGVSAGTIFGMKKTRFTPAGSGPNERLRHLRRLHLQPRTVRRSQWQSELHVRPSTRCRIRCGKWSTSTMPAFPTGVLVGTIPAGSIITAVMVQIATVFNAATTNVLTVGTTGTGTDLMTSRRRLRARRGRRRRPLTRRPPLRTPSQRSGHLRCLHADRHRRDDWRRVRPDHLPPNNDR